MAASEFIPADVTKNWLYFYESDPEILDIIDTPDFFEPNGISKVENVTKDELSYQMMDEMTLKSTVYIRYKEKLKSDMEVLVPIQVSYIWYHAFRDAIYTRYGPKQEFAVEPKDA